MTNQYWLSLSFCHVIHFEGASLDSPRMSPFCGQWRNERVGTTTTVPVQQNVGSWKLRDACKSGGFFFVYGMADHPGVQFYDYVLLVQQCPERTVNHFQMRLHSSLHTKVATGFSNENV